MNKQEYINKLWLAKSPPEIVLVMFRLIENAQHAQLYKDKVYAVMKGILAYLERGDELLDHHRKFLHKEWHIAWNAQEDDSVKDDIKEWLTE